MFQGWPATSVKNYHVLAAQRLSPRLECASEAAPCAVTERARNSFDWQAAGSKHLIRHHKPEVLQQGHETRPFCLQLSVERSRRHTQRPRHLLNTWELAMALIENFTNPV